jgi:putative effector of murein hydrolase LrgA (UPF0299 family)
MIAAVLVASGLLAVVVAAFNADKVILWHRKRKADRIRRVM